MPKKRVQRIVKRTDPTPEIETPEGSHPGASPEMPEEPRAGSSVETESQSEPLTEMIEELEIGDDETIAKRRMLYPSRPERKGGSIGRNVLLKTNHFNLKIGKDAFVYHYDVKIEEEIPETETPEQKAAQMGMKPEKKGKAHMIHRKASSMFNRDLFNKMYEQHNGRGHSFYKINPVYDGKANMYTSRVIIPGTENRRILALPVEFEEFERIRKFIVKMQLTKTNQCIDLGILNPVNRKNVSADLIDDVIVAANIILRYKPTLTKIAIGQSLYDPNERRMQLNSFERNRQLIGGLTEVSFGNYQSVRNLMCGATVNVDRSMAIFVQNQTVEAIIRLLFNANITEIPQKFGKMNAEKIENEIVGLQIEATHIKYGGHFRKYRVLGLSDTAIESEMFEWIDTDENGKKINKGMTSVAAYFKEKYRIRNINPKLQCIVVGNEKKQIKLPFEVCRIVENQCLRRELTKTERSEITTHSIQTPSERFRSIENCVKSLNALNRTYISEFDIEIDDKPIIANGRVIEPPTLSNNSPNNPITPKNGYWDMRGKMFYQCASIENWILIDMSHVRNAPRNQWDLHEEDYNKFVKDIQFIAQEHNMAFKLPFKNIRIDNPKKINIKPAFEKAKSLWKTLKFIWFIMPDKSYYNDNNLHVDTLYDEIKHMGDSVFGISTQCISINNFKPSRNVKGCAEVNKSVINNCLLKVNAKLGGINVMLKTQILKSKNVMIVGADVNHPAPADKVSPSIAATVGSYDMNFCKYTSSISLQRKFRDEIIKNIDKMMIFHLNEYGKSNNGLPNEIIFYRDGVGESQFGHVLENEVPLIREAFKKYQNYKPKLTFIVVQKRHHTRFIPADVKGNERQQNVEPGTVVDQTIVHPTDFDFYLCSHEGIQGTSRASHYYVLEDDNKFSSNDLQRLTYYLCYGYVRCNKAVSIPTPVYYAHHLAFRAKGYLSAIKNELGPVPRQRDEEEYERYLRDVMPKMTINDALRKEIFFC